MDFNVAKRAGRCRKPAPEHRIQRGVILPPLTWQGPCLRSPRRTRSGAGGESRGRIPPPATPSRNTSRRRTNNRENRMKPARSAGIPAAGKPVMKHRWGEARRAARDRVQGGKTLPERGKKASADVRR